MNYQQKTRQTDAFSHATETGPTQQGGCTDCWTSKSI